MEDLLQRKLQQREKRSHSNYRWHVSKWPLQHSIWHRIFCFVRESHQADHVWLWLILVWYHSDFDICNQCLYSHCQGWINHNNLETIRNKEFLLQLIHLCWKQSPIWTESEWKNRCAATCRGVSACHRCRLLSVGCSHFLYSQKEEIQRFKDWRKGRWLKLGERLLWELSSRFHTWGSQLREPRSRQPGPQPSLHQPHITPRRLLDSQLFLSMRGWSLFWVYFYFLSKGLYFYLIRLQLSVACRLVISLFQLPVDSYWNIWNDLIQCEPHVPICIRFLYCMNVFNQKFGFLWYSTTSHIFVQRKTLEFTASLVFLFVNCYIGLDLFCWDFPTHFNFKRKGSNEVHL